MQETIDAILIGAALAMVLVGLILDIRQRRRDRRAAMAARLDAAIPPKKGN